MRDFILRLAFVCAFFPFLTNAQILAWDFFGESSPVTSTADLMNVNLAASNLLTRGAGAPASSATNSFRTQGFQNDGIAVSNTDYFQFTLQAASGYELSISSVEARFRGTTTFAADPGVSHQYAYSLDGTTFTLIGSPQVTVGEPAQLTSDFSGVTALQNVPSGTTVTIRYYASGQTTTGGWGFHSPSAGTYGLAVFGALTLAACETESFISETACGSFDFFGTILTESGNFQHVLSGANAADCDSTVNLTLTIVSGFTFYADTDGDGYGDPANSVVACEQPLGYVSNNDDCDDTNNQVPFVRYEDNDFDGYGAGSPQLFCVNPGLGYSIFDTDCDDEDATVFPGAPELCDGKDNDCNGQVDDGLPLMTYYVDADGDGFGAGSALQFCANPGVGYSTNNLDCNDSDNTIYPGAPEIPDDGIDQNCDGTDATILGTQLAIYEFNGTVDCTIQDNEVTAQPENATFSVYSSQGTSCSNAGGVFNRSGWNTNPGIDLNRYNQFTVTADECYTLSLTKFKFDHRVSNITAVPTWYVRSSVDGYSTDLATGNSNTSVQTFEFLLGPEFQNLSEVTFRLYVSGVTANATTWRNDNVSVMGYINALPLQTYYADADGDGFGNPDVTIEWCEAPSGYVSNADDCNDDSALINPNTVWFLDNDGDGYGDNSTATTSCVQPGPDYVLAGGDCDDTNEEVNPSAPEVCNGIDDNCNGLIDAQDPDVEDADVYYVDEDEDGYGVGDPILFCSNPGPGYATVAGDCNDQNPDVNPGVSEICNGEDTDCNGLIDDGLEFTTYYVDADGDGFGAGEGIEFCADPGEGYSTVDGDCNDEDPTIYPGAEEIADDGIDQDCDGEDLSTASIAKNDWVKFDLVPNPSAGKVTVRFNQNVHDTDVTIFALTGQQVASFKVNGTSAVLNLSHFNDGVYLVRIRSDRGEHTSRLILAK
jgi:hypothetical protein